MMSSNRLRMVILAVLMAAVALSVWFVFSESSNLRDARLSVEQRDFSTALQLLQPSLMQSRPDRDALLLGARTARRANQFGLADQFLRKYLERGGDAEIIAIERILSSIQRGELGTFGGGTRFCEKNPGHPEVPFVLEAMTIGYQKAGHLVGAFDSSSRWLELELPPADKAQAYLARARCYQSTGNLDQARADARAAHELTPRSVEVNLLLGELLGESDSETAIRHYSTVLEREPENVDARIGLARAFRNQAESDRAMKALNEVLLASPRNVTALIERGKLLMDAKQFDSAMRDLQTALALEPRSRSALTNLARVYQLTGKSREAEDTRDRVKQIEEELFRRIREGVAAGTIPAPPPGTDLTLPNGS